VAAVLLLATCSISIWAQAPDSLEARIQKVMARPEFARSNFGIEFYDLETGKVVYALNADKLFVPASTTKLLTEGTVLAKLGPDYRFHTGIYRTGPIDKHGTLKGNLILVASGDPNLSNRIQADGTMAFVDEDHSYNGPALPGDPLAVIKDFAAQVAAKGIRRIEGRVYVDTSLMPDGEHEGGTGVTMSSIIVNDNIVDLTATPGTKVGDPVAFGVSPQTSYFHFVNAMTTGPAESKVSFDATDPAPRAERGDGRFVHQLHVADGIGRARGKANEQLVPIDLRREGLAREQHRPELGQDDRDQRDAERDVDALVNPVERGRVGGPGEQVEVQQSGAGRLVVAGQPRVVGGVGQQAGDGLDTQADQQHQAEHGGQPLAAQRAAPEAGPARSARRRRSCP